MHILLPVLALCSHSLFYQDGDSAAIRSTMEFQPDTLRELVRAGSDLSLKTKVCLVDDMQIVV